MSENFDTIVVCDFEYEVAGGDYGLQPGDLPVPLCMVAHGLDENLRHVRTVRLWRGEFGSAPPFDIGPDTLFVAYSAWAEMTCFKVLGWPFPAHIFDQHTAYLAASNILLPYDPDETRKKPRKRLSDACRAYRIEGWERIDKETIAKDIGEGRWRNYGHEQVFEYCEEDVRMSVRLLRAQLRGRPGLPPADVERALHWSNYSAKCIALIQARGMPIDMTLWPLVQENKGAVIGEFLRRFDPSYGSDDPIYTPEGEWSYERFQQWLIRRSVTAWPRLDSGRLNINSDAFRMMYHVPGIEELHALRDSLGFIMKARLPIGRDGRNRPSLFPFGTATGRNAHAKSPYNAHAGVRSFMVFPPDMIGCYLDWRTQEVGIAAALSGDTALMDAYRAGDIYHSLALVLGFTDDPDPVHWKKTNPAMRNRMKVLQLAISYGMGVPSLARGLDRHPLIASEIIERHKRSYLRFWEWRADMVQTAMLKRRIESVYGWPLHISTSPNQRTLYNFPMQSGGAEMLRLATIRLCEAGIVPIMLIHDGILLEEESRERIEHAKEIMRSAGRDVCGQPHNRRRSRPDVGKWRPLPRQAADGAKNVANGDARLGSRRRRAQKGSGMSTPTRFVTRHGKQIEVETIPFQAQPSKARRREADLFSKMPLQWSSAATKALGSRQSFVLIWLMHLAWKNKSMTFTLANTALAGYGVSRGMKYRALAKLEIAALIKVERRPGQAIIVTLLNV